MRHHFRLAGIGLIIALFATASAASSTSAKTRAPRLHKHARSHRGVTSPAVAGDARRADAARDGGQAKGPYAGAGGIYGPDYQLSDPGTIHLGAQLLGGDFGKAYEDYYRHYYYYKYAYCPIGTGYVIYLRRCVGLGNLFQ